MKKSIRNFTNEYDLYLQDESRKTGYAETVSFPKDIEEAASIVKYCCENDVPVTVRSGGTGVGAGAVPFGGHLMSMEKIKGLKMGADGMSVIAGAGCSLNEINRFITINTGGNLFLPPDPTEGSAGAGGMVSCNSSGARTYMYGPVRNYVKRLTIILSDGKILDIERGKIFASGRNFEINGEALGGTGKISGKLPGYIMPKVKNAAGYYICDDMDLIDIFIGSEGTLGIVAEAEFSLIKKPENIWGIIAFFKNDNEGVEFSELLKNSEALKDSIMSIEFFDKGSLDILREKADPASVAGGLRRVPEGFREAVFSEICGDTKDHMMLILEKMEYMIAEAGGDPEDAWCAVSRRSFEAFKELRHATPEGVNNRIAEIKKKCPVITKLGSDMSVPKEHFKDTVAMYRNDLEAVGLEHAMFGHIGDSHLHVNIISRDGADYKKGKALFAEWAEYIGRIGGSVSAEHGVGKLKRDFLIKMYGEKAVDEMRGLKRLFDPKCILNKNNVFLCYNEDNRMNQEEKQ